MKRKFISIVVVLSMILLNTTPAYADMGGMMDFPDMGMDFSMNMIMDQGMMSMDGADDMIVQAEETNFMNHENDNTLSFFFDNLDQYQEMDMFFSEETIIQDAFQDGSWSDNFNDHFNVDSGLLFPEVDFIQEINVDSPQEMDNGSDITSNNDMPEQNFAENPDLPEENALQNHSDVVDQIENNTMPEELPQSSLDEELPTGLDNGLDNSTENSIPEDSFEISQPSNNDEGNDISDKKGEDN